MEPLLEALASSDIAQMMRQSRWGYASVATVHVLGIALLVGAILPYNLRLLGIARSLPLDRLAALLPPTAMAGLALAIPSGGLLAIGDLPRYAGFETFQIKLVLIVFAVASAVFARARYGGDLRRASNRQLRHIAVISLAGWLGALVAGRLIAFVHG